MSVELRRTFLIALGGWPWLSVRCNKMVKALPQMPVERNKMTDCQLGFQNTLRFVCCARQSGAYPGFFNKKRLRNITKCTRWMPMTVDCRLISSVFSPVSLTVCWKLFIFLCGERHCENKMFCKRTQNNDPAKTRLKIVRLFLFLWDLPETKHF